MRGIALILILAGPVLLPALPTSAAASTAPDILLEGEYRRDTMDYESAVKDYFRLRAGVIFSRESALNIATVYRDLGRERSCTWSLLLGDVSPGLSLLAGHFLADFGHGLYIGRSTSYNPDIFSVKVKDDPGSPFIPVKSGNPSFAFQGAAASFNGELPSVRYSLHAFYSLRERYIGEDEYEAGSTMSGLGTITGKREKSASDSEPVDLHERGVMLSAELHRLFLIQFYHVLTGIESPSGRTIAWDCEKTGNLLHGYSLLSGSGALLQYRDDFLRIYFEGSRSERKPAGDGADRGDISGYGMLGGLSFRVPLLSLSITLKETGADYLAPYSSSIGENWPERACFLDAALRPSGGWSLGLSASSERRNAPSPSDDGIAYILRERIFARRTGVFLKMLGAEISRAVLVSGAAKEERVRVRSSAQIALTAGFTIDSFGTYQISRGAGASRILDLGFNVPLLGPLSLTAHYARGRISAGNPVYMVFPSLPRTNVPGIFIAEDSDILTVKTELRFRTCCFSGRYLQQFRGDTVLLRRLEFYGSGYF